MFKNIWNMKTVFCSNNKLFFSRVALFYQLLLFFFKIPQSCQILKGSPSPLLSLPFLQTIKYLSFQKHVLASCVAKCTSFVSSLVRATQKVTQTHHHQHPQPRAHTLNTPHHTTHDTENNTHTTTHNSIAESLEKLRRVRSIHGIRPPNWSLAVDCMVFVRVSILTSPETVLWTSAWRSATRQSTPR